MQNRKGGRGWIKAKRERRGEGEPRIRSGVLGLNKVPGLRPSLIGPTEAWANRAWAAELNLAAAGH